MGKTAQAEIFAGVALPIFHNDIDVRAGFDGDYLPTRNHVYGGFGYARPNAESNKAATNNHNDARNTGKQG